MSYLGACNGCGGLGVEDPIIMHAGPCTTAEIQAGAANSPQGCVFGGAEGAFVRKTATTRPSTAEVEGAFTGGAPKLPPLTPSSDLAPSPYRAATILGIPRVPFFVGAGALTVLGIALVLRAGRGRRGRRR